MVPWQRRREPEDVPTPLAVSLSDYCRRAQSPASPAEVREALALLGEEEEFRVKALADAEPEARPLGPFAAIDILRGTTPQLAAQRQACGYYEVVRELAAERARKAPPPPAVRAEELPRAAVKPSPPAAVSRREARPSPPTLQERIAPKRRAAAPPLAEPIEPPSLRKAPAPRGRFAQLPAAKLPFEELAGAQAGAQLAQQVAQHGHRFALLRALAAQYTGRLGATLTEEDLEAALGRHRLLERLHTQEGDLVRTTLRETRGALGRAAWTVGLSPAEMNRLVTSLGLTQEIEAIREHFRRDALAAPLRIRMDLLSRGKYLADLGIQKRLQEAVRAELHALLVKSGARSDLKRAVEEVARNQGFQPERLARAMERLGIGQDLRPPSSGETIQPT